MTPTASLDRIAAAVRARAIVLSRAELPLFLGLLALLLGLWVFALIAFGLGGERLSAAPTGAALVACGTPAASREAAKPDDATAPLNAPA